VEVFSVKPGGRVPEVIAYVYGAVPPVAASLGVRVPTVALPPPHVPHSRSTGVLTVMLQLPSVKLTAPSNTLPAAARTPMYL